MIVERKEAKVPLRLWGYVLFVFIAVQTSIYVFLPDQYAISQKRRYKQLTNHVQQEFEENPYALKAIVVGSSMAQYGIDCPETLKELVGKEKDPMVALCRLWMYHGKFNELVQKHHLFDFLKEVKPDVVCIQRELLAIEFVGGKASLEQENTLGVAVNVFNKQVQRYKYFLKSRLYQVLGDQNRPMNREEYICLEDEFDKPMEIDSLNFQAVRRKVLPFEALSYAHPKIRELQDLGIQVVILDVSRPSGAEHITQSEEFQLQFSNRMNEYKRKLGLEYWAYDGSPVYFSESVDGGHLNYKGRRKYTEWLLKKIMKETNLLVNRKMKKTLISNSNTGSQSISGKKSRSLQ